MGIGEAPKIALIALGRGLPALPQHLRRHPQHRPQVPRGRATRCGLTRSQRLRHVVVPGALPQALVGLRQSLGVAWLSLIVAETVSADSGLGYLINHAREFLQTDVIVVGLAVYSLLGLADRRPRPLPREEGAGMALRPTEPPDHARTPTPSPRVTDRTAPSATTTCCARLDLDHPARRVRRPARPQRLGQVDPAAQPGRPRPGPARRGRTCTGARAVAFQEPRLLPWRRVGDNVALALLNAPATARADRARAEARSRRSA